MYKICVLMTTYNPKKYLLEQLKSIYAQRDVDVHVVIRDDCSTDKTFLELAKKEYSFLLLEGKNNVGVGKNIQKLLQYAYQYKQGYDYYAYSDQDDVWLENKLITAIQYLKQMNQVKPCVYYGNLLVVDENLSFSHELFPRSIVKNTYGQSLAQVFMFACTSVFNYKTIVEIKDIDFSQVGFDTCLYYMGIWKGDIFFDDVPHIQYRQHQDNVSGVKKKGISYLIGKLKNIQQIMTDKPFQKNSEFLIENFHLNTHEKYELIKMVANYKTFFDRLKIIMNKEIKAGYYPKDLYRIVRLILGAY